jgi:hypothetical protein
MLGRDGIGGLVVLATSLVLFALTLELKASSFVPIGPGFYPRIVLGVTALFGLLLVVFDWRARRVKPERRAAGAGHDYAAVALHFAVFGLYCAALPALGFRIATFVYVAVANALMAPPRNARQWLRVGAIAFLTALVTWLVFERYLSVLLPRGRWTDF